MLKWLQKEGAGPPGEVRQSGRQPLLDSRVYMACEMAGKYLGRRRDVGRTRNEIGNVTRGGGQFILDLHKWPIVLEADMAYLSLTSENRHTVYVPSSQPRPVGSGRWICPPVSSPRHWCVFVAHHEAAVGAIKHHILRAHTFCFPRLTCPPTLTPNRYFDIFH